MKDLKNRLQKIDGRGYKSYKDIEGVYDFSFYTLYIDHVQGNPFAAPSRIRVSVFPEELWSGVRRVALEDYLTWRFQAAIFDAVRGRQGRGKGGLLRYLKSCSFGWQGASCYQDAVKIRAEDGRRVEKVYVSPFINKLPYGQDAKRLISHEASGSTSQATNIMEALEIGTSLLLLERIPVLLIS